MIVAANRDEFSSRPSAAPGVLGRNPLIFGGKDLLAGGTWLGVNEHGLLAGIVNRRAEPDAEVAASRSRGLLCLDILSAKEPLEARRLLSGQQGRLYRPFNLLFANKDRAYVAYNREREISWIELDKGLHVISNTSLYDRRSEKMDRSYLLFSRAWEQATAKGERESWMQALKTALSDHTLASGRSDPKGSVCVHTESYGTVSSSIIFYVSAEKRFYNCCAPGPPCRNGFGEPLTVSAL